MSLLQTLPVLSWDTSLSLNSMDSPCGHGLVDRFSRQSGRCYSFLLKCSCFIMKCTTSSVLGDRFMQWKDNGLGVEFSICFCSGINLGKPRVASCPEKGHPYTCLHVYIGHFLQSALWIHRFCIHRFKQTQTKINFKKIQKVSKAKLEFSAPCWQLFI